MPDRNNSKTQTTSDLPQQCRYTWYTTDDAPRSGSSKVQGSDPPVSRCKHASYVDDGILYIHGGRSGGMCYREMWRCDLMEERWEKVKCRGDQPLSPQEHTIVAYKNKLYVFGGQFACASDTEPPLWVLDLKTMVWSKQLSHGEPVTPGGRRGHTAVIFQDVMCIYGGYVDLKGSSNEIWNYDLREETWHSVNHSSMYDLNPDGRHSHSAVVHDGAMWVYGGMSDLHPKDDFWRWDFICSQWNRVKSRPSPPSLKGHSAACVQGQMLMFGGASQGSLSNSLWCFHFGTYAWTKLVPLGPSPPVCIHHCCVVMATSSPDGKPTARTQSCPQLKKSSLKLPVDIKRPFSSPPQASSTSETPVLFHNKISPAEDCKTKPLTVNLNTAKPKEDSEKSTKNTVQEYSASTSPESLSPTSSLTRKLWCRSTSFISNDENLSEDIPLSEIRRSASIDSLSLNSADYMDTVAGSYVNRILTAVNNLRRNMYHVVPNVVVDDSPASYKRQKSAHNNLDSRRKLNHNSEEQSSEAKENQPSLSGDTGSVLTRVRGIHHPAGDSDADDMQVVDVDECDDDLTFNMKSIDTSYASDTTFNNSNFSETAPLLKRSTQARSEAHGRSEARSVVRCFQGNYSRLNDSSDSLPYGIVNPLCNASQPQTPAQEEDPVPEQRQWKETRDGQVDSLRSMSPTPRLDPPPPRINRDTTRLGVHRTRQQSSVLSMGDAPGRPLVSSKDPCGPAPRPIDPPSYESVIKHEPQPPTYSENVSDNGATDLDPLLPSGSATGVRQSSNITRSDAKRSSSGRSDKIPTAWAGASPEKTMVKLPAPSETKKDLQGTLGATGGEPLETAGKSCDWATAKTQADTGPQNFVMYVVGGQTSEVTRLGAKPLLMLRLGVETGVR